MAMACTFRASRITMTVLALCAASVLGDVPAAHAQTRVMMTRSIGGGGGNAAAMIPRRSVDLYSRLLELTSDQRDVATTLYEGYAAAFREAQGEYRREMEEVMRSFEENEDQSLLTEKMPELQKKMTDRGAKLESDFFADLKAVLQPAQADRWDHVERARRRETVLRTGAMAGESVDLVEIVSGLGLPISAGTPIAEAMAAYESEMDKALAAKQAMWASQGELKPGNLDIEDIRKRMAESREVALRIKEVNDRNAHKLANLLPEASRPAFEDAVRRQSFPRVYRPSQVARRFDAALKLEGLDAAARQQIQQLKETYEREVSPVNDAWAAAIAANEAKDGGSLGSPGGGMVIQIRDQEEDPKLAEARKARREIDNRFRERLDTLLTPEQREKLPKTAPRAPGEDEEDGPVIVGG